MIYTISFHALNINFMLFNQHALPINISLFVRGSKYYHASRNEWTHAYVASLPTRSSHTVSHTTRIYMFLTTERVYTDVSNIRLRIKNSTNNNWMSSSFWNNITISDWSKAKYRIILLVEVPRPERSDKN